MFFFYGEILYNSGITWNIALQLQATFLEMLKQSYCSGQNIF